MLKIICHFLFKDRIYDKYVRKSVDDLLEMNGRSSRLSRTGRRSHGTTAFQLRQFSTELSNVQDGKLNDELSGTLLINKLSFSKLLSNILSLI